MRPETQSSTFGTEAPARGDHAERSTAAVSEPQPASAEPARGEDDWNYEPTQTPFGIPLDEEFLFLFPIGLGVLVVVFLALVYLAL